MDNPVVYYGLFLAATFCAALVAGVSGFAFALIAAGVWLHVLSPWQTATLLIGFGLMVQGLAVWKLRHAIEWAKLWPFLLGAAVGVPIGVAMLGRADPHTLQIAVGTFLTLYTLYSLTRPSLAPIRKSGALLDGSIGVANGILGGATGLAGIVLVIWCGLRGWPRDVQRAVFQPVTVATFAMAGLWLGARGMIALDALPLFVMGLPALLVGTWLGLKLYGQLNEASFRRLVLLLLLLSGMVLLARGLIR